MSSTPAAHPYPETLIAYIQGQLSPDEERELKQHLARC
jgi:anti-sigma factor RsiW